MLAWGPTGVSDGGRQNLVVAEAQQGTPDSKMPVAIKNGRRSARRGPPKKLMPVAIKNYDETARFFLVAVVAAVKTWRVFTATGSNNHGEERADEAPGLQDPNG